MSWLFDGVDDLVPSGTEIIGSVWSISAWIYPVTAGEGSQAYIVAQGTGNPSNGRFLLQLFNTPADSFQFRCRRATTSGFWHGGASAIEYNKWQHLMVTYDGTVVGNDPLFYKNGQLLTATRTSVPSGALTTDNLALYIGTDSSTARTFDGSIGEVCIWPKVLSAVEVANIYLKGARMMPDYSFYFPGAHSADVNSGKQQLPNGAQSLTLSNGVLVGENPPVNCMGARG